MRRTFVLTLLIFIAQGLYAQSNQPWTEIGPIKFPINQSGQIHGIGRVVQIKFHPTTAAKMYAVSAHALWKTTDTGRTWSIVPGTDDMPTMACASVCVDRTNENIMYLGTGDPNYYSQSLGVWKSTNGGTLFTRIGESTIGTRMAVEILQSPSAVNTLLAATNDGIWKSTDAGSTWTKTQADVNFCDMRMNAASGSTTVYAITRQAEFYKSTDFGDTWTLITTVNPATPGSGSRIAVTPANPAVVYVACIGSNTTLGGIIYKSTDSGNVFTQIRGDINPNLAGYDGNSGGQGNYNFDITAGWNDANTLFLVSHIVWRSQDGGVTWSKMQDGWWTEIHTDMHAIRYHPLIPSQIYNANDGGVWISTDGGSLWTAKSDGLASTEFYHIGNSHKTIGVMGGGTQDNGEVYYNVNTWYTNRGGDYTPFYQFDGQLTNSAYYGATQRRQLLTNTTQNLSLPSPASGAARLAFSRNVDIAFTGNDTVYRTQNLQTNPPAWTAIYNTSKSIKSLEPSVNNVNYLYLVLNTEFYLCQNALAATPVFTKQSDVPASISGGVQIATVANDPNVVYLSCGSRMYRSTNAGVNWTNISGTLPSVNIREILTDTTSTDESTYLINNLVYYKNKNMTDWVIYSHGMPSNSQFRDIDIYYSGGTKLLRVGTYGRGIWEVPLATTGSVLIPGGIYEIKSAAALTRNVDVPASATANGTDLIIYSDGSTNNQRWQISPLGNGYYKLIPQHATGKVMDVEGALTANGTAVQIYDSVNVPQQQWLIEGVGGGYYRLMPKHAPGKSLDLNGGTDANNTKVQIWDSNTSNAQKWRFDLISSPPAPLALMAVNTLKEQQPVNTYTIRLYPNPASQSATIEFSNAQDETALLTVSNTEGKVVLWRKQQLVKGINKVSLQVNELPKGIYFIKVDTGSRSATEKLVVQ